MLELDELGQATDVTDSTSSAKVTPEPVAGNAIDERIDELIVDLNRYYNPGAKR